jgi:predicted metal-dependent phosphoesterase TrpH
MSPRRIVGEAIRQGLAVLAITDHNSAENVAATMRAAHDTGVTVLPGMEVCTIEEVHVLAIFDNLEAALELQSAVYDSLHELNDTDVFGLQVVTGAEDEVEGFQEKLLIGATDLTVDDVVQRIHRGKGLAIASHIDREAYSIVGQLGFIPTTLRFDALEISSAMSDEEAARRFREYRSYALVRNSDAHSLQEMGKSVTHFLVERPTCEELGRAFRKEGGRLARVRYGGEERG